ncbi:MAG: CorA family divalent cation transporter [Candidatus Micrarchaeota archaeon]
MVEKLKQQLRAKLSPDNVILALEEKGFCVTQLKDGTVTRNEARNIEDLAKFVNGSSIAWADYVIEDMENDAPKAAAAFGFSETLIKTLLKEKRSGYEDLESEMGIMLPAILVTGFSVNLNPLLILLNKNLILTLHTTEVKRFFRLRRYGEPMMRKLPRKALLKDKLTMVLIRILDENNSRNFDHLREIEEHGDKLSAELADPKTRRELLGQKIYEMKHTLILYLDGLWATIDALNSLRYGDADILTDNAKLLNRINALVGEVQSQIGLAEHLSEVLASGLEVVQSIYNNQLQVLNNKLALLVGYLTIIGTALIVPNTIATALSNPAFSLTPKDVWWYSAVLVGSTILSTLVAWWWVKQQGFLPKSYDDTE